MDSLKKRINLRIVFRPRCSIIKFEPNHHYEKSALSNSLFLFCWYYNFLLVFCSWYDRDDMHKTRSSEQSDWRYRAVSNRLTNNYDYFLFQLWFLFVFRHYQYLWDKFFTTPLIDKKTYIFYGEMCVWLSVWWDSRRM